MQEYRMASAPMVKAPGIVRWAVNGYAFKKDRPKILAVLKAWPIPEVALKKLASGEVEYTVDAEDTVIFTA